MSKSTEWLKAQWEWIKSFASEPPDVSGYIKGSQKRFLSFWVVLAFVIAWFKKMMNMNPADPIPDIPPTWAVLILAILGLGIYANQVATKGRQDEIEIKQKDCDSEEQKKRIGSAIIKLDARLKKLEKDEPTI